MEAQQIQKLVDKQAVRAVRALGLAAEHPQEMGARRIRLTDARQELESGTNR